MNPIDDETRFVRGTTTILLKERKVLALLELSNTTGHAHTQYAEKNRIKIFSLTATAIHKLYKLSG